MKVLYDHQTFSLQNYGGISRIFTELLKVEAEEDVETKLSLVFSNNAYLKELKSIRVFSFLQNYEGPHKTSFIYALNKLYSIYILKTSSFNIFHPTYYDPYFIKYLSGKPFVLTFHDLAHEKFADRYPVFAKDKLTIEGKKTLLAQAAKVIAVSESTKEDIISYYGTDGKKVEVIHLANSLNTTVKVKNKQIVKEPYILFVGKRDIYKNFSFFIESITQLLKDDNNLKLVCAGGGAFSEDEQILISRLSLTKKVEYVSINNEETLINLYSNALCFVFPSLLEGFGIPVLEAFAFGCPCALSNCSSLPEVGGNAALYFNPQDAQSISGVVERLIHDKGLRHEKIVKGYERLAYFSWHKTRQQTFEVYRSLI